MRDFNYYQIDEYYLDLQRQAQEMNIDEEGGYTNPFPGLRTFRTDEAHLFFGREGQSEELIERLLRTRFLAVLGNSGSGKSSLVRAGLIPAVHAGVNQGKPSRWKIVICRPGNKPVLNLAAALASAQLKSADASVIAPKVGEIAEKLWESSFGLVEVEEETGEDEKTLLIIDQFEELFRFSREIVKEDAARFVNLLLTAVEQQRIPIYVVITMRSEFLGECVRVRGLPEIINRGQYLVPRLTSDNIRHAIADPLAMVGATIDPTLINRLLRELGDKMDQLPLLQHALMRTYHHWKDQGGHGAVNHRNYEASGGIQKALGLHADEHYNALDEKGRAIARLLFQRLTDLTAGSMGGRRPTRMEEIYGIASVLPASREDVNNVIGQFRRVDTSFLMPPPGSALKEESVLDIAHESLIRNWTRLTDWAKEETENVRLYQRLHQAFEENKQDAEQGWIKGALLQRLQEWQQENRLNEYWAARYHTEKGTSLDWAEHKRIFTDNIAFLNDCIEREEAVRFRQEKERQEQLETAQRQAAQERALRAQAEVAKKEAEIAKIEAEDQRSLALVNARQAAKRTRLAGVVSLLALALAGVAGWFYVRAAEDRQLTEAAKDRAEVAKMEAEGAKNKAEASLQEAKRQEQKAIAATQKAEKNYSDAQANLRRAEQEEKRTRAALTQVEREKEATEAQRRIAEENYSQAQESSRLAKVEAERARRVLAELEETNKSVVRLLLKNVEADIMVLAYNEAYAKIKSAASLKAVKDSVATAALELAFWYGETGQQSLADTMMQKAYTLLDKQYYASNGLRASIEAIDKTIFTRLMTKYYPLDTVRLAGGIFDMGCKPGRDGGNYCEEDEILHKQTVSSFIINRHEITWWQYRLFCEARQLACTAPYWGIQGDNPAVNVSWYDAVEYANWVSTQLGLTAAYTIDKSTRDLTNQSEYDEIKWTVRPQNGSQGYRLPTEAEWEYAARGGQEQAYAGCSSPEELREYAWHKGNSKSHTQSIKSRKPNAYGLYDMSGNVWEWCWDWYGDYPKGENRRDYSGSESGSYRVNRGGAWDGLPQRCRVANRLIYTPSTRNNIVGFRLARTP